MNYDWAQFEDIYILSENCATLLDRKMDKLAVNACNFCYIYFRKFSGLSIIRNCWRWGTCTNIWEYLPLNTTEVKTQLSLGCFDVVFVVVVVVDIVVVTTTTQPQLNTT